MKKIFFAGLLLLLLMPVSAPAQEQAIDAAALYREYEENEIAADAKYKNTRFAVTGEIRAIGKTIGDKPYIYLATGRYTSQVTLMFPARKYDTQLAAMKKGETIRAKGVCRGMKIGMVIIDIE